MQIIKDNACLIDAIAKESIIKNHAKLKKTRVKSIVFSSTDYDTKTNSTRGHTHLIFYYQGHTWHYDNGMGTIKAYAHKYEKNILNVIKRVYSLHYPHIKVQKVVPLNLMTNFDRYAKPLPKKYIND